PSPPPRGEGPGVGGAEGEHRAGDEGRTDTIRRRRISMTNRPAVTPALLEEYCKKFRNWGRWGAEDELGTVNFITPDVIKRAACSSTSPATRASPISSRAPRSTPRISTAARPSSACRSYRATSC